MFPFEKFPVYILAEETYKLIGRKILSKSGLDKSLRDQLKRATLSIALNIAEGAGKYSKPDKKNFYVIARGSTHESFISGLPLSIMVKSGYLHH